MHSKYFGQQEPRQTFVSVLVLTFAMSGCSNGSSSSDAKPLPSSSGSTPSNPAPTPARAAGQDELALVAPLVVGSSLEGYEVTEIQAIHRGALNVLCRKERSTVRLWISLASEKGPEPAAKADKYAVFYAASRMDPAEAERLSKALAEIVGKHADVPVPKGMTEFVPIAIPL